MFIDENNMVALEYVFYNTHSTSKYFKLEAPTNANFNSQLGISHYREGGVKHH